MNPPHEGHGRVIQKVRQIATKEKAPHLVVLSASHGGEKNPLPPLKKLDYVRHSFPGNKIVLASDRYPGLLQQVEKINGQCDELHIVAGGDRVKEYQDLLNKYNGRTYKFDKITVHSAGVRNKRYGEVSGLSGTKMREYAKDDDFHRFKRNLSPHLSYMTARKLFDDVKKGLGVKKEDLELNQAFARTMMTELFEKGYPIVLGKDYSDNPDPVKDKDVAVKQVKKIARKKQQSNWIVGNKVVSTVGTGIGPTYDSRMAGGAGGASGGIGDPSFRESSYWEPMMPAFGAGQVSNREPMQTMGQKVLSNMTGFSLKKKSKNFQQLRKSLPYG